MNSFDRLFPGPMIIQQERSQFDSEEKYRQYKNALKIFKRREKLWDKKAMEFEKLDLDIQDKIWSNISKYYKSPHLQFEWQHQWWTLSKKNFKKFKWIL